MSAEAFRAEIEDIQGAAARELSACTTAAELEQARARFLGRRSRLSQLIRSLGSLPEGDRPSVGLMANQVKAELTQVIDGRLARAQEWAAEARSELDVTLPGRRPAVGRKHPLTQIMGEIVEIFHGMGFSVASGPDIETEYFNFDALNTPPDHPSRDIQDTFYLENGYLLRTHTSPVQIRVMEGQQPPVRIIAPGRCFRRDAPDATHSPNFHQVEGLCVDEGVSMADLKGVLTAFAQALLGKDTAIRFRPHFFPFTEPSVEYDFSCVMCHGRGCPVCGGTGWLEISGAGMVHPNVFTQVGYDPEKYTGYAFGMGVERIAMVRFGIDHIRLFYENDLRFLDQF